MIRFGCPKCGKKLQVSIEHAGKISACPCGQRLRVPAHRASAAAPGSFSAAPSPSPYPSSSTTAPVASGATAGVNQPFGTTATVPGLAATSATHFPPAQSSPSPLAQPAAAMPPGYASRGGHPYAAQPALSTQSTAAPPASQEEVVPVFNKTTLVGVLMMVGAVVWFVAGLFAGYIFFYPPIMFVLGLVSFVKGMIGYAESNL